MSRTHWDQGVASGRIASAALVPGALLAGGARAWETASVRAWTGVAYGGSVGMVAAMALWGRSLGQLGPTETMVYVHLESVLAVVLAAIILGESLVRARSSVR